MSRSSPAPDPGEDLVPLADAAREVGLTYKSLYNRCYEGYVEHYACIRPGSERRSLIAIPRREIERLKREAYRPLITEKARAATVRAAMKPKPKARR